MKQVTKGITKITKIANAKIVITKITDSDTESDSVLIKKETIPLDSKDKKFL